MDNDQTPRAGSLTLEEIDVLEEFVERARLIVSTLGYRIFEPAGVPLVPLYTMVCKFADGRRFEAQLRENEDVAPKQDGRFTVLKGSMIALPLCGQPSLYERDRARRLQAPVDAQGKLQRDVSFRSASAAARYVVGCPVSGNKYWRMHGKTLGEIRRMRSTAPTAGC